MMDVLVASNEVEFVEDRDTIRQNIVTILTNQLREEEKMDAEARKKNRLHEKRRFWKTAKSGAFSIANFMRKNFAAQESRPPPRSIAAARKRTASRTQKLSWD